METEQQHVVIGVAQMKEAERIRTLLGRRGVDVRFYYNETTCKSGCSTSVEMLAMPGDIPEIQRFFDEEKAELLDGYEIDQGQINQVFDQSAESATCPACGTEFSTNLTVCPDCGLHF